MQLILATYEVDSNEQVIQASVQKAQDIDSSMKQFRPASRNNNMQEPSQQQQEVVVTKTEKIVTPPDMTTTQRVMRVLGRKAGHGEEVATNETQNNSKKEVKENE